MVGTKFTTARRTAETVVDSVCKSLGKAAERCLTSEVPLCPMLVPRLT